MSTIMATYLVATVARYVLVDAEDEKQARELGSVALRDLYADVREKLERDVPITICTVREATQDEIDLWSWHHKMIQQEKTNEQHSI